MQTNLPDFNRSFLPILSAACEKYADDECLRFNGTAYSYAEVGGLSDRIAAQLQAEGFVPGMKGAVYSLNSAISFISTLGILKAGGIWIPINPRNSSGDNVKILQQFGCEAIFFQQAFVDPVTEFAASTSSPLTRVCLDSPAAGSPFLEAWMSGAAAQPRPVSPAPTDLMTIPLTGGTTGLPKGVMLSHRNFCALEYATRLMYDGRRPVVLCAAPMTHVGGRIALCGMSSGARYVIMEQVDPQQILHTIEAEGITDFFLPPTGIYALLDQPNVGDIDYSSLHSVSYGSAPISTGRLVEAIETFGPVMRGGFGQTECPMFIARLHPREHFTDNNPDNPIHPTRLKSVGRETPISTLAIVDENAHPLPAGSKGEIAVQGPMVSEGYYNNPEETAKIRVNGWHLTGDIGYMDDEGYLYVVDRKKDMIITGGFNVYSTEVEQALMRIHGVQLAVVIGVPDAKWGEAVAAYVQLEAGCSLSAADIMQTAKDDIGGVKAPKQVHFVAELPRTAVGKIDKKQLRATAWEGQERSI